MRKSEVLETVTCIQQNRPIKKFKVIRHIDTHVAVQQRNKEFVLVSFKDHPRVRSRGGCPYQFMKSYPPPDDIAIPHKDQTILPIGITTQILTVFLKATTASIRTFNLLIQISQQLRSKMQIKLSLVEILVVICNLADLSQLLRPKYTLLDRDLL